jgi:hypothetical protein
MSDEENDTGKSYFFFRLALFSLLFLVGGVFALNDLQPFRFFHKACRDLLVLLGELSQTRPAILETRKYPGEGVLVHDSTQSSEGLTAIQGIFREGVQVKLLNMDGMEIHHWDIDFFKIWPNPKHLYPERIIPQNRFNFHSQGMVVHSNGSIVVNAGDFGAVKLDKCSNVIWTLDRMTHHSITMTEEGNYWIPGHRDLRHISAEKLRIAGLTRHALESQFLTQDTWGTFENLLLLVNSQGQVLKEISVLQALINGGFERQLYDAIQIKRSDPTHINDIEVVTRALADKISGIGVGDLLVSIRQMHMLAVFDKDTGKIKWHHEGPWVMQHDPDIMPDGNIVVYNNRPLSLNRIFCSNLMELNPNNNEVAVIYPLKNQKAFFSHIFGSHQLLPNGNRLVVESLSGRVFEINPEGNVVWDYVEAYDDQYASLIETAERYDSEYFSVDNWKCD